VNVREPVSGGGRESNPPPGVLAGVVKCCSVPLTWDDVFSDVRLVSPGIALYRNFRDQSVTSQPSGTSRRGQTWGSFAEVPNGWDPS
jgi:hypothetical protein